MNEEFSLSVILPIKSSLVKDFDTYFNGAIESIKNQRVPCSELVIVQTKEETLTKYLDDFDFGDLNITKVVFGGEPSFAEQVNVGVKAAKSEWVSILEFDDEYSSIWFKNVKEYIHHYPDSDAFLPIVVDTDSNNNYAGMTNEAAFASNFAQDLGILTNSMLMDYQNFQTSGMVIKKRAFEDAGGFKPSIKLTFVYEMLLRLTYNSVKIMVIPKIGYKHLNMREGSIFWNYKFGSDKMGDDEVKFWLQTAKKEYFFTQDRNLKYESQ